MSHFPSGELRLRKMKHLPKAPGKAWQKQGTASRPLPSHPACFTRRCYQKPSMAKDTCNFQGFSCAFHVQRSFCVMMEQEQPEGFPIVWKQGISARICSSGSNFH